MFSVSTRLPTPLGREWYEIIVVCYTAWGYSSFMVLVPEL